MTWSLKGEQESAFARPPPHGSGCGNRKTVWAVGNQKPEQKYTSPSLCPVVLKKRIIKCPCFSSTKGSRAEKASQLIVVWRAQEKGQLYIQVSSVYERSIVLLHSNSFQRNLWSETVLAGLHINATTEKKKKNGPTVGKGAL